MKIGINLHPRLYLVVPWSFVRVKYFVLLFVLIVGLPVSSFSKDYYVKSSGNDNNTGLSDDQAWRTIAKVNASVFLPGDRVLFNNGDIWRETLIISSSGGDGQPIAFSSYGTGNKPVIQPTTQVMSWTQVGTTNIWYATLVKEPAQVFINDMYVQPAHWPTAVGDRTPTFQYPSGNSADATHLTDADLSGLTEANLVGAQVNIYTTGFTQKNVAISAFNDAADILTMATVTIPPDTTMRYYLTAPAKAGISFSSKAWMVTENTWFYDTDAQRLYVWKTGGGNPGSIEVSTGKNAIYSTDKSNVVIDGIHARYAAEIGIFCTNWDSSIADIIIKNCASNFNHSVGIRVGKTLNSSVYTLTNVRIINNSLDHNGNVGIFTNYAFNSSIAGNNITYTGGLFPQLPAGGKNPLTAGIYIYADNNEFLIDGNIISFTTQNGIFYSGSPQGKIINNTISNTCIYLLDAGGIYSAQKSTDVIISYNTLLTTGYGIYFDNATDGGRVEHNHVIGGAEGMLLNNAKNIVAQYNQFTGPFTAGYIITVNSGPSTTPLPNTFGYNIINGVDKSASGILLGWTDDLINSLIDINNNVILNCDFGISIVQKLPLAIKDIKNNIFYNNNTHIATTPGNVLSINYNLFWGTGNWIWNGSIIEAFTHWKTTSSGDVNSIYADPLFVSSNDFHLRTISPCIGAGIDVGLTTDYDGNASSNPPSIGAYEYYSEPITTVLPVYQSSVVENVTPSIIEFTYNLALANIVPATSAFSVQVNSAARSINSVSISDTKVLLTLSSPVAYGNTVTVTYSKPSTNPLQTSAGGQAANLTAQSVTNRVSAPPAPAVPSFSGASVENAAPSVIVMTYSLALSAIIPPVSAFSVTVNSAVRSISSVSLSGTTIFLTLSSPVTYGNTVNVAYTAPSTNPLQTSSGGKAISFAAQAVTNRVNYISPPPVGVVPNNPPVPVVSYAAEEYSGFTGVINANGSYDANMDKITFSWKIPTNIPVSSTNNAVIKYLAPIVQNKQTYEFVLTVSDGKSTQTKKVPVEILPYQPDLKTAEISLIEASDYNMTDIPSKAVDGNTSTMWSCKGEDHFLVLKLKSLFNVKHIMLSFQPGQTKESYFDIYCSTDGETWDLVLAKAKSCSFSGNLQIFDFPDSKAENEYSFIKLVGLGNSVDNWNYISEFRIFGYPHENPTDYEDLEIKIYPNPTSEIVNILIDEPSFNPDFINIISLTGEIIYSNKVDPEIRQFQVPVNFRKGVYIVQMGTGEITMFTQKLVVIN